MCIDVRSDMCLEVRLDVRLDVCTDIFVFQVSSARAVDFVSLSAASTMAVMLKIDVMISVFGAALSNGIFLREGTVVLACRYYGPVAYPWPFL